MKGDERVIYLRLRELEAEAEALREVARAAREAEDTLRAYGTGVHLIGGRHKLKAALARLDGEW